jgi:hypothetical protein
MTSTATTEQPPARPIFVIGSLRSGASLLGLSLGQHPDIKLVLDTAWVERVALGLQQAYTEDAARDELSQLLALGVDNRAYFAHFGEAINRLLLGPPSVPAGSPPGEPVPTWRDLGRAERERAGTRDDYWPTRWVDTSYTHVFNVFLLQRLFPAARFIHTVRAADEVAASLTAPDSESTYRSRHVPFTVQDAYEQWLDAVTAGREAEQAFSAETVLRVWRTELVAEPEAVLRRCLDFLDEPFDPQCLRPFRTSDAPEPIADAPAPDPRADLPPDLLAEIDLVSRDLFADPPAALAPHPDVSRIARMEAEFAARGMASL